MNLAMNWKFSHLPPNVAKRLMAILLVGFCLGLVFWSVTIRLSLVTQAQSDMHSSFNLARELETLQSSWSEPEADAIGQDWKQFQAKNFTDYDQLVQWISRFSTRAHTLGMQVAYKIGEEGLPIQGLPTVRPVVIEFSLRTQKPKDGYEHFLRFMREVSESEVDITLDQVELSGIGRGVQKLDIKLLAYMNHHT